MEKGKEFKQPELLQSDIPIDETNLVAESPRHAYYRVSVYYLPGAGYRVEKASGAAGSRPNSENFWRPTLRLALEKKSKLVQSKLKIRKGRPRQYTEVVVERSEGRF